MREVFRVINTATTIVTFLIERPHQRLATREGKAAKAVTQ
jgi:hypothetical protein